MRNRWIGVAVALILIFSAGPACSTQTDWQVRQTLKFESEPLDMVVSPRGRRVYVLNKDGEILVYSMEGKLKGNIAVGTDVFQIKAGPSDGQLYLLSRKNKTLQSITIDVTEKIEVQGSPYKGAEKAPVTVAVFSDFQ